jgi:hypothetical protein
MSDHFDSQLFADCDSGEKGKVRVARNRSRLIVLWIHPDCVISAFSITKAAVLLEVFLQHDSLHTPAP